MDDGVPSFVEVGLGNLVPADSMLLEIDPESVTVSQHVETIFRPNDVAPQRQQGFGCWDFGDEINPFQIERFFVIGGVGDPTTEDSRGDPLRLQPENGLCLFLPGESIHGGATLVAIGDLATRPSRL